MKNGMLYRVQFSLPDTRGKKNITMCHPHMRFAPENKDLCHHAEELLGIRV